MTNYNKTRSQYQNSRHNVGQKVGYDYRGGKLLRKSISKYFYTEEKRSGILDQFSSILEYMIDTVKHIRKQYMITVDKNSIDMN